MITQTFLAEISKKCNDFQKSCSSFPTNSTICFPNRLKLLFNDDSNATIPKPVKIKCYTNPISDDDYKHTISLSLSSTQKVFEYEKEVIIYCLVFFHFCADRDEALIKFNGIVDPEQNLSIENEFKDYLNCSDFYAYIDNIKPKNIIKFFKYQFNYLTFYEAFNDSYKQKCLIVKNIIYPAFLSCIKLKKILNDKSPCSLTIYNSNSSTISEVTKIDFNKNKNNFIGQFIEDLHNEIFDDEKESIEISNSISEKIFAFKRQIAQKNILKICEQKFDLMKIDEKSLNQLNDFITENNENLSDSHEEILIKKAYYLACFMYKASLYGIGKYSHQFVDICGVRILSNTSNSDSTKFTFTINKIPEITYAFCYEILNTINKVSLINEVEKLRNSEGKNVFELIKSVKLQMIAQKFNEIRSDLEKENNDYRKKFFDRFTSIPAQYRMDYNTLIDSITSTVQMTEKIAVYFVDIIPHMKENMRKAKDLENKRGLITWIEKMPNLNKNTIALKVEKIANDIKLKEIYFDNDYL